MANRKFLNFFHSLNEEQQIYFGHTLPNLIEDWYEGHLLGQQRSEGLEINARKYYQVDALAVALSHLKNVFPLRTPSTLYRLTHLKDAPSGPTVKVTYGNQLKPLLSFTSLKDPIVYGRESHSPDTVDVVLEWKADPRLVVMSTEWIVNVARNLSYDLNDMYDNGDISLSVFMHNKVSMALSWKHAWVAATTYIREKEYLVYIPKNKSITCKWRPAK